MLKEFSLQARDSFIGAWFLDDLTVCDGMIDFYETCDAFERSPGIVSSTNGPVLNKQWKNSTDLSVDVRLRDSRLQRYLEKFFDVIEMYKQKYPFAFNSAPWTIEDRLNVHRYPPEGGCVQWHTERNNGTQHCVYRHLAFMTYLHDVEDGGETEFFHQQVKVRPRKGLTLLWPSDWTHTHRGVPAPKEEKTLVTGWLKFM